MERGLDFIVHCPRSVCKAVVDNGNRESIKIWPPLPDIHHTACVCVKRRSLSLVFVTTVNKHDNEYLCVTESSESDKGVRHTDSAQQF